MHGCVVNIFTGSMSDGVSIGRGRGRGRGFVYSGDMRRNPWSVGGLQQ